MVSLFQMNSYVTHEQTLKAAQDHIELGKNEYSYNLLHEYIVGGKKKGNWSLTFEKLMTLFIDLSLRLENYSSMKEALTQYRQLSQFSNINSLESVLIYYRDKMEQIFEEKIGSKNIIQLVEVEDFDLEESNEDIMIYSLEIKQKSQREELKTVLRNLLDTYKNIIDIVRRNKKLEDLLVSTSEKAYDFCLKYKRRNEFKRLSESFFNYLTKIILPPLDNTKKNYQIDITSAETNDRFLAISFKQLNVAFAFELWQEAFRTIESINHIFYRRHKSPKTKLLSNYFDQLASVFWRSEYYLYHAYAFYQHFIIFKKFSKASPEEISQKTDYFVLSVLSIPPFGLENDQSEENRRRLCKIVSSAGSVSTRAELIATIQTSNLLDLVSPTVRDLFILMEEKFSLLNFGGPAESLLKKMEESPAYNKFINQIKTNFAYKAIENASNVYKTMKTSTLKRFLFFLNSDEIERILLNTHIHEHIRVRINQEKKVLIFNQMNTKADFSEASLHIVNFAYGVKEVVSSLSESAQENARLEDALKKEAILYLQNAEKTLKERMANIQNNQKKDPNAERQFLEQQEEQKREERKKNEEEERKRRKEMERREKEAELIELSIKKKEKILQDILKIKGNQIVKIDGKRLEQFKREELIAVEESTLTELKSMIQNREKENVENKYKRAFQRADYIERARREEEIKLLKETFHGENTEIPNILAAHKEVFDKNKALKESLTPALRFKEEFVKGELDKRESRYKDEIGKYKDDIDNNYREKLLTLARQKMKEHQKKTEEELKRRKQLEEEERKNIFNKQDEDRRKFGETVIVRGDKVRSTNTGNNNAADEKKETELSRSDRPRGVASNPAPEEKSGDVWRVERPRQQARENAPKVEEDPVRKPVTNSTKPEGEGLSFRNSNRANNDKPRAADNEPKKTGPSTGDNSGSAPFTHPGRGIPDSGETKKTFTNTKKDFGDRREAPTKDSAGPARSQGGPEKKDLTKSQNEPRKEFKGNDNKPAPAGGKRTFL